MEKKNVTVLLPTIEQLCTMRNILNRAQFHDGKDIFGYCFAKMVEWTIANGGLEKCSMDEFPEELAYIISRSTALIYPSELKYVDLPDIRMQDIYKDVFGRETVLDHPSNLDDLSFMKDDLKKEHYFIEKIIKAVYKELYRSDENRFVRPNNVNYRFDHNHDSIVRTLFAGEIFGMFNGTPSRDMIELCAKIEPLYLLKCKAEDLISYSDRGSKSYANGTQTCCLRGSVRDFASLYSVRNISPYETDIVDSDTDLMDKSNVYCKAIRNFFDKHGNSKQ